MGEDTHQLVYYRCVCVEVARAHGCDVREKVYTASRSGSTQVGESGPILTARMVKAIKASLLLLKDD